MINTSTNSVFPSQVVPEAEKRSLEYGLAVGQAIEYEWFRGGRVNNGRWNSSYNAFNRLRLYARGEQPVQKYKDELSINGDLSYLNLDWKPVPIIPKFVDIVVNGIAERMYDVKAYSQDYLSTQKRTAYLQNIIDDMSLQSLNEYNREVFGIDTTKSGLVELPETTEEVQLHMQLTYKPVSYTHLTLPTTPYV